MVGHDKNTSAEATTLPPVDVAVIGAGMAGLSAATYARQSGLSVRAFERHYIPGGLCTSWKRKHYTFDYCIEYFLGSGEGVDFYDMWKELGVIDGRSFQPIESFGRYVGAEGQVFELYTDPGQLQDHLLAIAPEDQDKIRELCGAIRQARHLHISEFVPTWKGLTRFVRSVPAFPAMKKWAGVSLRQWCSGLDNAFLRKALPAVVGLTDFPMAGPIMMFALMNTGDVAYPLGGSLPIALAVEERATSLGAEFVYRAGVKRVIVEQGRAVGIELDDGRVQPARHVVAACDARFAFDSLLGGRVQDAQYQALFDEASLHASMIQISLGVDIDPQWGLHELPFKVNVPLAAPIVVDGAEHSRLQIYNYVHDPSMAPDGHTVVLVKYAGDYDLWAALRADKGRYRSQKKTLLEETVRALEETFPGIGARIMAHDVATPTSCERYTGSWRGSSQGWIMTTEWLKTYVSGNQLPKTFPGVAGFHLIGQWTEPGGGLPPAARHGRNVIRAIMKSEGKRASR